MPCGKISKGYYVAYNNDGMAALLASPPVTDCNHDMRYIRFIGSGRSLCSVVFRFGRKTCILSRFRIFVTTSGSGSPAVLISALLQISKRMIMQFRNLPRTQIPIGMSAPSKSIQLTLGHGIQMTENILILPSLFILSKNTQRKYGCCRLRRGIHKINDVKRLWQDLYEI